MIIKKTQSGYNCFHILDDTSVVMMFYVGYNRKTVEKKFRALIKQRRQQNKKSHEAKSY